MLDLTPGTSALSAVLAGVRRDQLGRPTPCATACIGDLIDHVHGLAVAFRAAARKRHIGGEQRPTADATHLAGAWSERSAARLTEPASAWSDHSAWSGMTNVGGVELPAEVAGVVALNEVILHGWDIAVASGQPFGCEPHLVGEAFAFVQSSVAAHPSGSPGLFGAPVLVDGAAPLMDRLIGLSGRNPRWSTDR